VGIFEAFPVSRKLGVLKPFARGRGIPSYGGLPIRSRPRAARKTHAQIPTGGWNLRQIPRIAASDFDAENKSIGPLWTTDGWEAWKDYWQLS